MIDITILERLENLGMELMTYGNGSESHGWEGYHSYDDRALDYLPGEDNELDYADDFRGEDIRQVFGINQFPGLLLLKCFGASFSREGRADPHRVILAYHENEGDFESRSLLSSEEIWRNLSDYFGIMGKERLVGYAKGYRR